MEDLCSLLAMKDCIAQLDEYRSKAIVFTREIGKLKKKAEEISFIMNGGKLSTSKKLKKFVRRFASPTTILRSSQ